MARTQDPTRMWAARPKWPWEGRRKCQWAGSPRSPGLSRLSVVRNEMKGDGGGGEKLDINERAVVRMREYCTMGVIKK